MQYLIVVIIVALILGGAIFSHLQTQKRRAELQQWSASRGLSFTPDTDSSVDKRYPGFSCLNEGSGRYAFNVMQGTSGQQSVFAFDYHYETYSTDSKGHRSTHHHYFSAVIVETGFPLKPLSIRNEGFFDKVGAFMGFEDINFELAEFNSQFYVKSPDRRWAFDVLTQDAMEFLLESPRFVLEMENGRIIAARDNTFSTNEFDSALKLIGGLLDRIPSSVLNELKGAS